MNKRSNQENEIKVISHDHDIDQIREKLQKTPILDQSEGPDAKKIPTIDIDATQGEKYGSYTDPF
jgi:hypothetical protein